MATITLNKNEYNLRLGYKELKKLETFYPGRSFHDILEALGVNPTIHDLEIMVFVSLQKPGINLEEFSDLLGDEFENEESDFSFDKLLDGFMKAVDESVFIKRLQTEGEQVAKKKNLKKVKAI